VRQSLGKFSITPTLDFDRETSFDLPFEIKNTTPSEPIINVDPDYNPFKPSTFSKPSGSSVSSSYSSAIKSQGFGNRNIQAEEWERFYKIDEIAQIEPTENLGLNLEIEEKKNYLLKNGYLFTVVKSGMLILHVRRAKERIIYDQIMSQFVSQALHTQQLLFPIEKNVSGIEKKIWSGFQSMFERMGFISELKNDVLLISGIPNWLDEENGLECIDHIFNEMSQRDIDKGEIAHFIALEIAKSHANSFARQFKLNDAQLLIEQIFQCPEHMLSPKGKKIMDTLDLNKLTETF
jgi:DNA mismatch repair protein MutL